MIYVYLLVYIALLLIISWWISRRQSKEDFLISGRNRRGWQIFASKFAASIGAGYFISYTGFAYEYGLGVFTMLLGIIFGYLMFAYWAAPKIYANSKRKKFYTMGDFVYDKTKSRGSANFANFVSIAIGFAWLMVGIIGGAKIINDFGFISYIPAVLIMSGVVLAYILIAGHKAVILTDVLQSIIIVLLLFIVTFGIIGSDSVTELLGSSTGTTDLGVVVGFFLFGLLSVFSSADRYQLAYAAKNERSLKHGIGLAIIPLLFVAVLLLLIGIFMFNNLPGLDPGLIFTESLKNFLPASLLPLAVVLFFAGVMSSSDTGVYSISSHYAMSTKNWSIGKIKKVMIVLMILTSVVAIVFPDVIDISIIAGAISLTLSFPMVYVISGGKKASKFIASGIVSIIGLVIGISIFGLEPIAALFPVIGGALGLLWWK